MGQNTREFKVPVASLSASFIIVGRGFNETKIVLSKCDANFIRLLKETYI